MGKGLLRTKPINTVMKDSSRVDKSMEKEWRNPNFNCTKDIFSKEKDVGKEP